MNIKRTTLLGFLAVFWSFSLLHAQDEPISKSSTNNDLEITNSSVGGDVINYNKLPEEYWPIGTQIKKKNKDQYDAYINGDTLYSPRLRRQVAIGVGGGMATVSGDVHSVGGWGVSAFVRHNISYILSARYEFGFNRSWGQNYEARMITNQGMLSSAGTPSTWMPNEAYRRAGYKGTGINSVFDNYKTDIMELKASLLVNLTNIMLAHRGQHRFNLYAHIDAGVMNYKTWVDALDEDGQPYFAYKTLYGSDGIPELQADSKRGSQVAPSERSKVRKYLYNNVYEGRPRKRTYETVAEGHRNEGNIFDRVSNFVVGGGLGVEALLGKKKRFSLGLEHTVTMTNDDLIDGLRWTDQGDLTRDFDTYHTVLAKLSVFLGKKEKRTIPMWWDNPLSASLRKYEAPGDRFADDDVDGVDNFYDLEPNTQADCPVDSHGRLLDSDGDGCPDCEDPEPFSSPLLPIVDCKNVYDFASPECCASKKGATDVIPLPVIPFDVNKCGINKSQFSQLEQVAKAMQENPELNLVVTSISRSTKSVKYNEQLGWCRTNEVVDYLVEKYGISRDRFIEKYIGEVVQSEGGEFDKFQNNRVEFRFAEEGETGDNNLPAPHPGMKINK
ncbi:MAG: OmpA family protein [Chitinophagales bacterium]|nr:OmpA family protein [Chitinophagales bacterium]